MLSPPGKGIGGSKGASLGALPIYVGAHLGHIWRTEHTGQVLAYRAGIRPTIDFQPGTRPLLTKHQFLAAMNRTVGYTVAGYIGALTAHHAPTH